MLSAQSIESVVADSGVGDIMLTSMARLPPDAQSTTLSRIHSGFTGLHQLEAQLAPLITSPPRLLEDKHGGGWMFSAVLYSMFKVKQVKSQNKYKLTQFLGY